MGIEELEKYVESFKPVDTWGSRINRDRFWANKSSLLYFVDKIKEQIPTQPELVEVPEFVGELICWVKKNNAVPSDVISDFYSLAVDEINLPNTLDLEKLSVYFTLACHRFDFEKACIIGYTVKKEPTWVVQTDTGFLNFVAYSYKKPYEIETSLERKEAVEFKEKHIAEHIAAIIGGEAVPVGEEAE